MRASLADRIELDGKPLEANNGRVVAEVLIYHKPAGEVTTRSDPEGRPTVFERLPAPQVRSLDCRRPARYQHHRAPVVFTTDGELANRLMHPSGEVEREYLVRVRGIPTPATLQKLEQWRDSGAMVRRGSIASRSGVRRGAQLVPGVLREGRNREVRRVWEAVGHEVSRLSRIRYANILLPRDLRPGATRLATAQEIAELRAHCR